MLFGYDLHAALHEVPHVHQQRTDRFTGSLGRQCHEQIDVAGRLPIDTPDTSGLLCASPMHSHRG